MFKEWKTWLEISSCCVDESSFRLSLPSLLSDFLWLFLGFVSSLRAKTHKAVLDGRLLGFGFFKKCLVSKFVHFTRGVLCVAGSLWDLLHLKSQCWFCFSCAAGEFLMRSMGHSVYFVAIAGLQGLPYLLVTSSITIFNSQLSRSSLFSPMFYCFFIFLGVPVPLACSSIGDKQNLFCKVGEKNKLKKWAKRKERGLQKAVKLCSVSPVLHAVFNLLCASWRLWESGREREGIMLRNDRVAVTSKLSLEIQDIDFT